jgi:hypothetical protein
MNKTSYIETIRYYTAHIYTYILYIYTVYNCIYTIVAIPNTLWYTTVYGKLSQYLAGVLYSSDLPHAIPVGGWRWHERRFAGATVVGFTE